MTIFKQPGPEPGFAFSGERMNQTVDATVAAIGSKATQAGAATSVTSWVLSSEFGVLAGILIGFVGLIVNVYFKRREDKRLQAEHEARMREMRLGSHP
jgi:hypothetical protein